MMGVGKQRYFISKWQERLESDNLLKRYKSKQLVAIVSSRQKFDEFDIDLYFAMVEKIMVVGRKQMIVSLLDGAQVECETE